MFQADSPRLTTPPGLASVVACLVALSLVASPLWAHEPLDRQLDQVDAALEQDPTNNHLLLMHAELTFRQGQPAAALAALDQILSGSPEHTAAILLRSEVLMNQGHLFDALATIQRVFDSGHESFAAYWARGTLHRLVGDFDAAVADFARAADADQPVDLMLEWGRLEADRGDLEAAVAVYRHGLQHTGAVTLRLALFDTAMALGDGTTALEQVDAAIIAARNPTRWLLRRSDALRTLGRVADATAALEQALVHADRAVHGRQSCAALADRAGVLLALGRQDAALNDAGEAARRCPRSPGVGELLERTRTAQDGVRGGAN